MILCAIKKKIKNLSGLAHFCLHQSTKKRVKKNFGFNVLPAVDLLMQQFKKADAFCYCYFGAGLNNIVHLSNKIMNAGVRTGPVDEIPERSGGRQTDVVHGFSAKSSAPSSFRLGDSLGKFFTSPDGLPWPFSAHAQILY